MPKGVYKRTEEHKRKISASMKLAMNCPETKARLSASAKIIQNQPEMKRQKRERMLKNNSMHQPDIRAKHDEIIHSAEYIQTLKRACREATNRPGAVAQKASAASHAINNNRPGPTERLVDSIIQEAVPNTFMLTSPRQFRVGRRYPDWTCITGRPLLIDFFGSYWHSERKTGQTREEHEAERIQYFANYGFRTLIIWEDDLNDRNTLIERIRRFTAE